VNTREKCPKCGGEMEAEFVDIGIGWQQVTESMCMNQCDYIEWEYEQYKNKVENPLTVEEWLNLYVNN